LSLTKRSAKGRCFAEVSIYTYGSPNPQLSRKLKSMRVDEIPEWNFSLTIAEFKKTKKKLAFLIKI